MIYQNSMFFKLAGVWTFFLLSIKISWLESRHACRNFYDSPFKPMSLLYYSFLVSIFFKFQRKNLLRLFQISLHISRTEGNISIMKAYRNTHSFCNLIFFVSLIVNDISMMSIELYTSSRLLLWLPWICEKYKYFCGTSVFLPIYRILSMFLVDYDITFLCVRNSSASRFVHEKCFSIKKLRADDTWFCQHI